MAPFWQTRKRNRCIEIFDQVGCYKQPELRFVENEGSVARPPIIHLDRGKMMTHVLGCLAAMRFLNEEYEIEFKRLEEENNKIKENKSNEKMHELPEHSIQVLHAQNETFCVSVTLTLEGIFNAKDHHWKTDRLLRAFPDDSLSTDGRSWLPLHWAMVGCNRLQDTTVKILYKSDPMALQRHHIEGTDADLDRGLNAAHFLCSEEVTTPHFLSLFRYFTTVNSEAFTMSTSYPRGVDPDDDEHESDHETGVQYGASALHIAAKFTDSVRVMHTLLQLDPSQTTRRPNKNGLTPLGQLTSKRLFGSRNWEEIFKVLLEADSRPEIVGDALVGCFAKCRIAEFSKSIEPGSMGGKTIEFVSNLLQKYPEAALYRRHTDGGNLLHHLFCNEVGPPLCVSLVDIILSYNKDAVREANDDGDLPVHIAAIYSDLDCVHKFLQLYPESAEASNMMGRSILHLAGNNTDEKAAERIIR